MEGRDHNLVVKSSAEIEVQKRLEFLPITSSLCKVLQLESRISSDPLVGDLQVCCLKPTDQGPTGYLTYQDGSRASSRLR